MIMRIITDFLLKVSLVNAILEIIESKQQPLPNNEEFEEGCKNS